MLKVRDFGNFAEENRLREDQNDSDDDVICYDPPSRRRSRSRSKSPRRSRTPDYKSVPRLGDQKPLFGPRDTDGNISVKYPSAIDGYENDDESMARREAMGLPVGFALRPEVHVSTKQKKGDKKTFYCKICLIELNSYDTMVSHQKGVKHMKKELQKKEQEEERVHAGGTPMSPFEMQAIVPIPNPEKTKIKVPVRLHEKIKETRDPVVGLAYIKEFIASSDPEMEPHYECELCGNMGIANGMFAHIMGRMHRQKFIEAYYKNDVSRYLDLSQDELMKLARNHAENTEELHELIKTRRGDELYPWPPGKAPWAIANGGTGIPPDGARENWGKNSQFLPNREVKVLAVPADRKRSISSSSSILPNLKSVPAPKNKEDRMKMLALGEHLINLALESEEGISKVEKSSVKSILDTVLCKYKSAKGPDQSFSSDTETSRSENGDKENRHRVPRNSRSPSPVASKRERRESDSRKTQLRESSVHSRLGKRNGETSYAGRVKSERNSSDDSRPGSSRESNGGGQSSRYERRDRSRSRDSRYRESSRERYREYRRSDSRERSRREYEDHRR